jgi:hypothetical protein
VGKPGASALGGVIQRAGCVTIPHVDAPSIDEPVSLKQKGGRKSRPPLRQLIASSEPAVASTPLGQPPRRPRAAPGQFSARAELSRCRRRSAEPQAGQRPVGRRPRRHCAAVIGPRPPQSPRLHGRPKCALHWVEPKLVAEIVYLTWIADSLLRHTVYVALREDKPATRSRGKPRGLDSVPIRNTGTSPLGGLC